MADEKSFLEYARETAVDYIKTFLGIPYLWGGDDPIAGFDCSGVIVEILQAVGLIPAGVDMTANSLLNYFRDKEQTDPLQPPKPGCLVFYLDSPNGRATHVMMTITPHHVIGAAGGGSKTTSIKEAIRMNAFMKIRPIRYRNDEIVIVDPFKEE